jgi:hypothetical protein
MANLNLSQFTEKTLVADADWVFVWDTAGAISKKVSRNSLLNSGTLATSAPVTISQTWNDAAVAFTALKVNATSTNSAAGSLLLDLQVGGASQFNVDKSGTLRMRPLDAETKMAYSAAGFLFYGSGAPSLFIGQDGTGAGNAVMSSIGFIGFASTSVAASGNSDTRLYRDSASGNTLALRNGAAAQTFRVYNTYTDANNYSRLKIGWDAVTYAAFTIEGQQLGTGGGRSLALIGGGNVLGLGVAPSGNFNWVINSGHFLAGTDNSVDIGSSGANRPRDIYVGTSVNAGVSLSAGSRAALLSASGNAVFTTYNNSPLLIAYNNGTELVKVASSTSWMFTSTVLVQFGGTSASFPALKRSSTTLQARLADDSAFAPIQGKLTTDTAFTSGAITDTGYIVLYDSTGAAYKVACTPV